VKVNGTSRQGRWPALAFAALLVAFLALSGIAAVGLAPVTSPVMAAAATPGCTATSGVTVVVDFSHWPTGPQSGAVIDSCETTAAATTQTVGGKEESTGTALDALENAGFDVSGTSQYGDAFMCRIGYGSNADNEEPVNDPCTSTPPSSAYWAYYWADACTNSWTYSEAGPEGRDPYIGGVEYWTFGSDAAGSTLPVSPNQLRGQGPLSVVSPTLEAGQVGQPYTDHVAMSGDLCPSSDDVFSLAPGSTLPAGLSLSSDGVVSGTPSATGTTSFSVKLSDTAGNVGTASLSLSVLDLEPTTLPGAVAGRSYSQSLSTTGGTGPYSYSLAAGSSLPAGLSLSSGGIISGTPTSGGSASFTVNVTDGSGATDGAVLTLGVSGGAAALTIGPAVLPDATVGQSYNHQLSTTGGTSPYRYSLASGSSLPTGLALSSSGLISGTPKTAGSTKVTVKVSDASGDSGTSALALSVASVSSAKGGAGASGKGTASTSTTGSSSSTSTTAGANQPAVKGDPRLKIVREGAPTSHQVHSSSGSIVPVIVGIALGAVLLGTGAGVATRRRRRLSEEDHQV
jgi:hypothetical protein